MMTSSPLHSLPWILLYQTRCLPHCSQLTHPHPAIYYFLHAIQQQVDSIWHDSVFGVVCPHLKSWLIYGWSVRSLFSLGCDLSLLHEGTREKYWFLALRPHQRQGCFHLHYHQAEMKIRFVQDLPFAGTRCQKHLAVIILRIAQFPHPHLHALFLLRNLNYPHR